ncbi:MAG: hypothetical protein MUC88_24690 [Planctomycetes bacterium]|jgi:hypothetical protein|nr:hypothetical protein [Bryobacter sp.]MCU0917732.1 hypothetical protein [Planctomycetota bacterium]HPV81765.1 hypothetical protein [Nitrospira sp.]
MDNRHILELLNDAESALRENLHRHDLDPNARAHMERAVSHTREAYIATNEIGKARTVQRLVGDLDKADRLIAKLRGLRPQGGNVKSIRI